MQELGKTAPGPLGFGRPRAQKKAAAMLILGEVDPGDGAGEAAWARASKVDALIVRLGASANLPDGLDEPLKERLWGASFAAATGEQMDELGKAGCDFVIVESRQSPAVVLRDDEMARGLPVRLGISEEEARPLEDLPVDLLIVQSDPAWWPLTVERLVHLQATVSMVSKHILLRVEKCPPRQDLPLVRDLPVDALVVDLTTISDADLDEIRSAIDELPPRKPKSEKGMSPVLPRTGVAPAGADHEHEEEEDDDYDGDDDE
jgi:hypothetical protein